MAGSFLLYCVFLLSFVKNFEIQPLRNGFFNRQEGCYRLSSFGVLFYNYSVGSFSTKMAFECHTDLEKAPGNDMFLLFSFFDYCTFLWGLMNEFCVSMRLPKHYSTVQNPAKYPRNIFYR